MTPRIAGSPCLLMNCPLIAVFFDKGISDANGARAYIVEASGRISGFYALDAALCVTDAALCVTFAALRFAAARRFALSRINPS